MTGTSSPPRTSRRSPPAQRHPSSSTPTTSIATNTTTTTATNISLALHRPVERPNVPIAPASSNTSSPIYSTTSSPPISPGVHQYSGCSLGTMAPSRPDPRSAALALELPPTSTPTGRISKAKKGKRVHACEFPGCGKVFTRAEHRRRHELNHNPDATYRCAQQGCGKSFHRIDLLQRHQERHDLEASTQPSSPRRYPSNADVMPEPPTAMPTTTMASPQMPPAPSRAPGSHMSIPSLMNHSYHQPFMNPYIQSFSSPAAWESLYVTDPMSSPNRGYHRSSVSATSSVAGFDTSSGSPMVTAAMPQATWNPVAPPTALPANMFDDRTSPYPSSAAVNSTPIPLSDLDGFEWECIGRELPAMPGLLPSPNRAGVPDTLRWHCLDLYWQCFHPTYPVVHRPTFLIGNQPPPLLACAMVAIGSYYDTKKDAKQYSLVLLEIATKILRRRPSNPGRNHRPRIVDLQTVVLLEILSTFCARQISVQVSTKFRSMFANLNHFSILPPLAVFEISKQDRSPAKLAEAQQFWIENETRSRILHACSVLDSQQTILFEQPPTVRKYAHLRVDTSNVKQVHLPCDDELWDASPVERWAKIAENHEYIQINGGQVMMSPSRQTGYSYFQQQVINANLEGTPRVSPQAKNMTASVEDRSIKSEFDYHATQMCKHTPIRHLLTVTGESWLLGRKIERKQDYIRAGQTLRSWLNGSPHNQSQYSESKMAHWHALKLLRILLIEDPPCVSRGEIFGTTHMLHENWVVYLASLVCWANGQRRRDSGIALYPLQTTPGTQGLMGSTDDEPSAPDSITGSATGGGVSCLNDPLRAAREAETYLFFTDVSLLTAFQELRPAILTRTQGLLESVRTQKITKHMMGGLMNDAEQVLLKLVEGKKHITF